MCFSSEASFISSFALISYSIYAIVKYRKHGYIFPAFYPLLFGIQQGIEGIIWVVFRYPDQKIIYYLSLSYLFFAIFVWPIFVPIFGLLYENNLYRRRLFYFFIGLGFVYGCCAYVPLLFQTDSINTQIVKQCVRYSYSTNILNINPVIFASIYLLCCPISLFISSRKELRFFGVLSVICYIITKTFYNFSFVSVWCFFSAILSVFAIQIQSKNNFSDRAVKV